MTKYSDSPRNEGDVNEVEILNEALPTEVDDGVKDGQIENDNNSVASETKQKAGKKEHKAKHSKKKALNSMSEELRKAEEKLKTREMTKLTVLSIEVSNLPAVHRFTKNLPWLQGAYGKNYSWVADCNRNGTGDKASWGDLQVQLF